MELKHENRPSELPAGADYRMEGPIVCEFTYYAKNEAGKIVSTKVRFPCGQIPTPAELAREIADCRAELAGAEGYAEINKAEFWRHICSAKTGELLPMPGNLAWEKRQ
jgi:hypothetical protein